MDKNIKLFVAGESEVVWHHWVFLCAQLLALPFCIYLLFKLPPPGVGAVFIAVVSVAMAVHDKMLFLRKFLWVVVIVMLCVVEYRSISKDRADSNARAEQYRREQAAQFEAGLKKTLGSLKSAIEATKASQIQSQEGFSAELEKSEKLGQKTQQVLRAAEVGLNYQTGGDSFVYLDLNLYGPNGPAVQSLNLFKRGDAPVYDLNVEMSAQRIVEDLSAETSGPSDVRTLRIGNLGSGNLDVRDFMVFTRKPQRGTNERLQLSLDTHPVEITYVFQARNGTWWESELLRRIPDPDIRGLTRWVRSIRVLQKTEAGNIKIRYSEIDPGFRAEKNDFCHGLEGAAFGCY